MRLTLSLFSLAWILTGCSLPSQEGRQYSESLTALATQDSRLGQSITQIRAQHPADQSGIYALHDPHEAFAARALLARKADHSLDVQYYIWRDDKTGNMLLRELLQAADRGVRVRLLLDDGGTTGLDKSLAAMSMHPNIHVRLFNPFVMRTGKYLGYVTHFSRTNRRMHNKSFTADSQATIIGGRNVGNEYFGATDGVLFADLDVLTIGPAVDDLSKDFDRYWNSASAYPVQRIVGASSEAALTQLRQQLETLAASPASQDFVQALHSTPFIEHLTEGKLPMEWAKVQLVSDDPAKVLSKAQPEGLMLPQLMALMGSPQHSLDLVSPYFVPTKKGTADFAQLQQQGVRVRVLTNSLEATDVALVHSGYAKYRKPLLQAGIQLFEMRSTNPEKVGLNDQLKLGSYGSSGSSLHAKTFAIDDKKAFVGSFNFDPRSAELNTELGFLIDSPAMAQQIANSFDTQVPLRSFSVQLNEDGDLRWHSQNADEPKVYDVEPYSSWWVRVMLKVMGWLPIEGLL